jgi:hypothetical protein
MLLHLAFLAILLLYGLLVLCLILGGSSHHGRKAL